MEAMPRTRCHRLGIVFAALSALLSSHGANLGNFQEHGDVGEVRHPGWVTFDPAAGSYTVAGGGANMWFTNDALHFVWKRVTGDVTLAADIQVLGSDGDPHRKACLLVRQSLDPGSAYADVAIHADGLTSLQYRASAGDRTYEIQSGVSNPKRVRIEKRGRYFSMSVAGDDGRLRPAGGSFRMDLTEPFYVGIGVCAHNNDAIEKAVFSKVELATPAAAEARTRLSTLEVVALSSKDRRAVWSSTNHFEAPNWSRDGASLIFNSRGRLYRIPVAGGEPALIDTGFAIRCNNDHGVSPDGSTLVISDHSQEDRMSRIYTLPSAGGVPKLITEAGPSYWHGWSPDGNTLAYCAERNGEYDIYTIPAEGGVERRLTTAKGLDDGPDFTADGQWIYFNSDRTGQMHIWRMRLDGSAQEQVTHDEFNNWFPHPSPDGKWLVFLSYDKEVQGHPENKDVSLRVMPLAGGKIEILARLFGGQGTINVPSWSPDSRRIAFVSYQLIP
jgi:TolB protein